jgi:NAD(P)-dependent dehydrogenase (short-subunit alcohol dehydrogenase family)
MIEIKEFEGTMETELINKTYVVTGATSGIGLTTAEALARAGAGVIGVGRSAERCREAEVHLHNLGHGASIHYLTADLSAQSEVRRLAEQITGQLAADGKAGLDGLVNDAGTFTYWLTLTPDGIEMQWAVNYLAAFLLTDLLMPVLKAAPMVRVVTVSSDSHYGARLDWDDPQLRRHYNGLRAYGNTKLAGVLFTLELNRRLGQGSGVHAFAVDPGLVKTDIGFKGTPELVQWVWKVRRSGGTSAEVPARCITYLLAEPSLQESNEVYWKDCNPKRASREALDGTSAERLWTLSEKLCGIEEKG